MVGVVETGVGSSSRWAGAIVGFVSCGYSRGGEYGVVYRYAS